MPPQPPTAPATAASHPHNEGPLWRVTQQELAQVFPEVGDPYEEWSIWFRTRSGFTGHVKVLAANYNAHNVAQTIDPLARQMEAVGKLHGAND